MIKRQSPLSSHIPHIEDTAPCGPEVTETDKRLTTIYLEILDRVEANECWQKITSDVLEIDPKSHPDFARDMFNSYYERSKWMRDEGYKQLTSAEIPVEMFRDWAASILLQMVHEGDIRNGGGKSPEMWAKETIQKLIDDGKLEPDPSMDASQCAEWIRELLGNE